MDCQMASEGLWHGALKTWSEKWQEMPSRKEEERRRKQQQRQQRDNSYSRTGRRGRQYASNEEDSIRSMQEYAEDVEFTETKEYSESEILENESRSERRVYREEQVSDAEYIEIKRKIIGNNQTKTAEWTRLYT